MATMGGDQTYLFVRGGRAEGGSALGRLLPRRADFENAPRTCLKLTFDFVPASGALQASWVSLVGEIASTTTLERLLGRLDIPARARPPLDPPGEEGLEWKWLLLPSDFDIIESLRGRDLRSPVKLWVRLHGIAQAGAGAIEVVGEGTIEIAASEWDALLGAFGYEAPSPVGGLVDGVVRDHPSWSEASRRLDRARQHLRQGESYEAFRSCLSEFELLASPPYSADAWKSCFLGLDPQKAQGVALTLSGHASLLNKIGHHRSRDTDESLQHPLMPLDYWEAEIGVANSQLLLAMALRLLDDGAKES